MTTTTAQMPEASPIPVSVTVSAQAQKPSYGANIIELMTEIRTYIKLLQSTYIGCDLNDFATHVLHELSVSAENLNDIVGW